ncbi:vitellogenin-A2 [Musca vetustissima]|uniref:vitellogenin-A2 n=1 Tax=Musca vetustissima TaxID=27455 RepID=UPI002AB5FB8A|nr:vitellogenin-A2 [Musca vetustissima]
MSNTMTAHEPINYLDSILNEEEKRCEYSHQWRNFTISRSGRFKSKNKHRNVVDGKMFDRNTGGSSSSSSTTMSQSPSSINSQTQSSATSSYDKDKKISSHYGSSASMKSYHQTQTPAKAISSSTTSSSSFTSSTANNRQRDKVDSYKSYYETNL